MDGADEDLRSRSTEGSPTFSRAAKRPRTTLACQRCKSRKQKVSPPGDYMQHADVDPGNCSVMAVGLRAHSVSGYPQHASM